MFIAPHTRTIHFLLPLSSPGDDFTFTISRSSDVYELSIANKRSRNDRHRSPSRVTKKREGGRKHKSTQAFLFPFVYLLDGSATAVRCANIAAKVSYSINHAPSTILLPILCTGMYICIYIHTYIYVYNTSMAWREVYKYLSIRIKEKEGEFGSAAALWLSHWISVISFFFFSFFYLCRGRCNWKIGNSNNSTNSINRKEKCIILNLLV